MKLQIKRMVDNLTFHNHYTMLIMLKLMNNSKRDTQIMKPALSGAIIAILFCLLSYVLFISLQSSISVQAQNLQTLSKLKMSPRSIFPQLYPKKLKKY